jgi:hypothetical protein
MKEMKFNIQSKKKKFSKKEKNAINKDMNSKNSFHDHTLKPKIFYCVKKITSGILVSILKK